jgi:hypothetical protein
MLGVPGPIGFQGTQFNLAWSANPSTGYFKHEYLPAGQRLESFAEMFIIEANASATPESAAAAQVNMLKQRKASDPVANYAMFRSDATGEIMVDFLVSDSSKGTQIVEWNAYRYARLGKTGGVALYAISRRAYGDKVQDFLRALKQARSPAINALAAFPMPVLRPGR